MVEILVKMKVVVSKTLLLGLCAYLRQLELSIDRSLGNLADFKAYCETGPTERLARVIERLGFFLPQITGVPSVNKELRTSPLFIRLWSWYSQAGVDVDGVLLMKVRALLERIAATLNAPTELSRNEFVEIRLDLNQAIHCLSYQIFPVSKRNTTLAVEHLNQNSILKTNSIAAIAGDANWLFS